MDWEAFYNTFRKPDFIPGYEIQNRLGGGAFGDVYKARKQSIGKSFAIKFLKLEDDAQREVVERELSQVGHFAAIDHPNLVTIEDMGTVMGVPYLIMGYAGEETLSRRLASGPLHEDEALPIFTQACRGVLALHDRRLVHFDLKPSNIFLKGKVARVGDYGLSKLLTDGRMTLSFGRGTPHYMAPEVLRSRADHRADVYSLGVILFESLVGHPPYTSTESGTLVFREDDAPPEFPTGFPERVRAVVLRCLRLDPDDRFQDVGALLEALGQTARQGESIRLDPKDEAAILRPGESGELTAVALAEARAAQRIQADSRPVSEIGVRLELPTPLEFAAPALGPATPTIPVPPHVEGGTLGTIFTSVVVAMEVLVAMLTLLMKAVPEGYTALGDALLRRPTGVGHRAAGLATFMLVMVLAGFIAIGTGLGSRDAWGAA
ncbi:MAG: serine/threonine-protein kinase [bacterium]